MSGSNPSAPLSHSLPFWKKPLFLAALIIAATLLAYLPATHGGYIWDDDVYVTDNPLLPAPDGLRRIWFSLDSPSQYFPLVYTTFRLEFAIWGLNPAGYHWVNIILHIANALLVWRLLARLKVPGAWLAAAIFALHPVHVESVAWITERKNVLSVFFFLLALLAWTEFIADDARKKWWFYAAALAFYALALFAKTTACTLPAALLLILWLQHKPVNLRRIAQIVPFLVLGAGMGMVTVWWERYHQGTQGRLFALGLPERLLVGSHAVWFYIIKLLWPADLTFSYPAWTLHPGNPLSWGWLLAGVALCHVIYRARKHIGRGAEVEALFFVATLSPVLGFIMLYTFRYSFVADHYQYAASIGPIALASAGIVTLAESRKKIRGVIYAGAAVVLLALGVLTWNQCHAYLNSETLWRDTLAKNPASWMAYNNLGTDFQQRGRVDEAIANYLKALELSPAQAEVENNLGFALQQSGELNQAIAHYQKALGIDPDFATAHFNLGNALHQTGQTGQSIAEYQKALQIAPGMPEAHLNLGNSFRQQGHAKEAIEQFQKALEINPNYEEAQSNLAYILATCPDESLRDGAKAVKLAQQANQAVKGGTPIVLYTLAAAYAEAGRFPEAVDAAQQALNLAIAQSNGALANALRSNIALYKAGTPFRDKSLTR